MFPVEQVRKLGHDRWKNENNGWNDLTQNWAIKHGFLHACKHRPVARTDEGTVETIDGTLQLTPNHGLAAVVLITCIAIALSPAFALMDSRIMRLRPISLREVGRQLYRTSMRRLPPIRHSWLHTLPSARGGCRTSFSNRRQAPSISPSRTPESALSRLANLLFSSQLRQTHAIPPIGRPPTCHANFPPR